jgi:hypothetical protein
MEVITGYQSGNNFILKSKLDPEVADHINQHYNAYFSYDQNAWILPYTNYDTILHDDYLKNFVQLGYKINKLPGSQSQNNNAREFRSQRIENNSQQFASQRMNKNYQQFGAQRTNNNSQQFGSQRMNNNSQQFDSQRMNNNSQQFGSQRINNNSQQFGSQRMNNNSQQFGSQRMNNNSQQFGSQRLGYQSNQLEKDNSSKDQSPRNAHQDYHSRKSSTIQKENPQTYSLGSSFVQQDYDGRSFMIQKDISQKDDVPKGSTSPMLIQTPNSLQSVNFIPVNQSTKRVNHEQLAALKKQDFIKDSVFSTGIAELDREIILTAKISDVLNMYHVSHYFRDLIDDPYTFLLFKKKYPFTVMTSFQDFFILDNELKKTVFRNNSQDVTSFQDFITLYKQQKESQPFKEIYLPGDRLVSGNPADYYENNYKVIDVRENALNLIKVNMLGTPLDDSLVTAKSARDYLYFIVDEGYKGPISRGIIKHELGPKITSVDSPFLLYKTYPLTPDFHTLRKLYPTEENYNKNIHEGLVCAVEYIDINDEMRFPYVIDNIDGDHVTLIYLGPNRYDHIFSTNITPLILDIIYDHDVSVWYSRKHGKIILTPGDWRENFVNSMSIVG